MVKIKFLFLIVLVLLNVFPMTEHLFAQGLEYPKAVTANITENNQGYSKDKNIPFKVIKAMLNQHEAEQRELANRQKAERSELREKQHHEKIHMLTTKSAQIEKTLREKLAQELELLQKEVAAEKEKLLKQKHEEEKSDQEKHHASEQMRSQRKQAVEVQLLPFKFPESHLPIPTPSGGMPLP